MGEVTSAMNKGGEFDFLPSRGESTKGENGLSRAGNRSWLIRFGGAFLKHQRKVKSGK